MWHRSLFASLVALTCVLFFPLTSLAQREKKRRAKNAGPAVAEGTAYGACGGYRDA